MLRKKQWLKDYPSLQSNQQTKKDLLILVQQEEYSTTKPLLTTLKITLNPEIITSCNIKTLAVETVQSV